MRLIAILATAAALSVLALPLAPSPPPLPELLPELPPLLRAAAPLCRTSTFGAVPSQEGYSTAALQAAIDACSGAHCGTVLVDLPGTYLTAQLLLTGCVHFVLPAGVTLLAGTQRADYAGGQSDWYLLLFRSCSGCSLSGGGTIDGQAQLWVLPAPALPGRGELELTQMHARQLSAQQQRQRDQQMSAQQQQQQQQQQWTHHEKGLLLPRKAVHNWADPSCTKPEECRPRLVGVLDSSDVSVAGIVLNDPVYWCLHVLRSRHVRISRLRIRGDWAIPNNDGIDVDSSCHVSIHDVDVGTADDAICLKTTAAGRPLEHVTITNCRLRSRSSAVKLGSESMADMRHISISRLSIADSHRGLAIQLRDGGNISDVRFERISLTTRYYHPSWWGAAEPIYVTAVPRDLGSQVGRVSTITFSDIQATAENGVFIAGGPLPPTPPPHLALAIGPLASALQAHCKIASGRTGSQVEPMQAGKGRQKQQEIPGQQRQQQKPGQRAQHSIAGIAVEGLRLRLQRRSHWPGGCQDYRPSSNTTGGNGGSSNSGGWSSSGRGERAACTSCTALARWPTGLDCSGGSTAAVWVAGADRVRFSDVQVEHCQEAWRPDWGQQLHIDEGSTSGVIMEDLQLRIRTCT